MIVINTVCSCFVNDRVAAVVVVVEVSIVSNKDVGGGGGGGVVFIKPITWSI